MGIKSEIKPDAFYMQLALNQAILAAQNNEVPVGAILVQNNQIIAQAHNQSIFKNDATAHAEIEVLRLASAKLSSYRLLKTTLFVTLEPCTMCLGAMIHARITRLVFATHDDKTGACGGCYDLTTSHCFNHKLEITSGVLQEDSKNLLKRFFTNCRKK